MFDYIFAKQIGLINYLKKGISIKVKKKISHQDLYRFKTITKKNYFIHKWDPSGTEVYLTNCFTDWGNEYLFLDSLREKGEGVFLDIGCHTGYFSCLFNEYFKKIIGFEPSNKCIRALDYIKKEYTNFDYITSFVGENEEIVKAFDISLILYAEHSFNVSTFTARTITSSLSDIHGAITGAIASLKGPLHGGANEEVMHMFKKIKKPENAKKWILDALENKKLIMGFGHRVYSKGDSRVPTMKKYYLKVAEILKEKKLPEMSQIIEDIMTEKKNIHPNLDYPTGPTYHLMGFDTDFFTPIFVISRITGWSAHIMEQHTANKLIRPLSKYSGEKHRKVMLLNQR